MALENLRKGIRFVAITCCGVLILSVFVNVVLRYVFNSGLPFGEDLTRYLMVVVVFFAASLALDSQRHISINLFVGKLSRYNQLRLELLFQICNIGLFSPPHDLWIHPAPQSVDGLHPHHEEGLDVLVLYQHSGWLYFNGDFSNQKPHLYTKGIESGAHIQNEIK